MRSPPPASRPAPRRASSTRSCSRCRSRPRACAPSWRAAASTPAWRRARSTAWGTPWCWPPPRAPPTPTSRRWWPPCRTCWRARTRRPSMADAKEAATTQPMSTLTQASGGRADFPLVFERSQPGRRAAHPPKVGDVDLEALLGAENLRREAPRLPEVSELDLVRHYTQLAHRQMSIDANFYPLGSCTMKYNPKVNEEAAKLFQDLHPYQAPETAQGALELLYNLQHDLAAITGMDAVSLQPAAGAHAELAGILMIRAYHEARGEGEQRRVVLVPDGAHGTNPATAAMAGYDV